MAAEPQGNVVLPATAMFQKAHGRIVMLQRIDEQLAVLLDQRRKVQEELRLVQQQINEEFERVIKQAGETPSKLLSQIAESARNGAPARIDIAEPVG